MYTSSDAAYVRFLSLIYTAPFPILHCTAVENPLVEAQVVAARAVRESGGTPVQGALNSHFAFFTREFRIANALPVFSLSSLCSYLLVYVPAARPLLDCSFQSFYPMHA